MNILVTNDDGWGFDGIETLAAVARQFGDVWIVAPELPMSGISHQLTFERPMRLVEKENQSYSLSGTPADCVRVGISQLPVKFDWVLSGINNGGNLGADVYVSGTVAAAREATLFRLPAIAISQYLDGFREDFDWGLAGQLTENVLRSLLNLDSQTGSFYNVNLPDTHGKPVDEVQLVHTEVDLQPLPVEYKQLSSTEIMYCGSYQKRPRQPGLDIDVCFGGDVAISKI